MRSYDVLVVGAGQAGIEAALACARMGVKTVCVTLRLDRIGHLPCNCSVGGPAKGHIAREVDALGGQMGITTDYTLTHIRKVGTSKGPAVQTFRAHVCKTLYPEMMRNVCENTENLTILEGAVEWIYHTATAVKGARVLLNGESEPIDIDARAIVVTTGTFLNGLCHEGKIKTVAARHGDVAVSGLSNYLQELGVVLRRFKTGTTPRIAKSSVDFAKLEAMESQPESGPVSFLHDTTFAKHALLPCWQTRTSTITHDILKENLQESAMFSGQIAGVGPRYCPSVEDKVVKFADKDSHPIFLEQEEWHTESMYVQGFSTSMPASVQLLALHSITGLENAVMMRPGYAVEYDMADPLQLEPTLMSKLMPGLFLAGQLNGTSGYEEAAGQGIVAGINATRFVRNQEPVLFPRSQSFIGVMIDDLVTKGVEDPYRMLTARAEHRLLLRHDNSDLRLTPISKEIGLCSEKRWARFAVKQESIESGRKWLESQWVTTADNVHLEPFKTSPVTHKITLFELMRRPEFRLEQAKLLCQVTERNWPISDAPEVTEQLDIAGMYEGYIQIQTRQADQASRLDHMVIPASLDWNNLVGLSYESREKLNKMMPSSVGQASRIPGVRAADISLIIGHIRYAFGTNQSR